MFRTLFLENGETFHVRYMFSVGITISLAMKQITIHTCIVTQCASFLDLLYSIKICIHSAVCNVTLSVLRVVACFVLQYEQITDILLLNV